jgi:hypothetical protein
MSNRDSIDNCDYRGSTPEANASGAEFQRQRAAETADERLKRCRRLDKLRELNKRRSTRTVE